MHNAQSDSYVWHQSTGAKPCLPYNLQVLSLHSALMMLCSLRWLGLYTEARLQKNGSPAIRLEWSCIQKIWCVAFRNMESLPGTCRKKDATLASLAVRIRGLEELAELRRAEVEVMFAMGQGWLQDAGQLRHAAQAALHALGATF